MLVYGRPVCKEMICKFQAGAEAIVSRILLVCLSGSKLVYETYLWNLINSFDSLGLT